MQKIGHMDVISCGIDLELSAKCIDLIKNAEVIFVSKSLLVLCTAWIDNKIQEIHLITAKAREDAKKALSLCQEGKQVVVLTSGDALYNGFGGTLLHVRHEQSITFHPHITAFQALFHKLGLPWNSVALFSVHSKECIPLRRIASAPFSLTYGGSRYTASRIAKKLMDFHAPLSPSVAVVAERLGTEDEKIQVGTLQELAQVSSHATSILLIVPPEYYKCLQHYRKIPMQTVIAPHISLGLPESYYAKENNLITASDVRAVILARLRLPAWGVLWDLGAGSGSVGLEAAGLCPHLKVLALEQKLSRLAHIEANTLKLGVDNYTLLHVNALEFLHNIEHISNESESIKDVSLLKPNRIFVGGGGKDIHKIIEPALEHLQPQGLLVVSAVTLQSFHTIAAYAKNCAAYHVHLSSIQISHEHDINADYSYLKAQNTIYLFTFCPKKYNETENEQ